MKGNRLAGAKHYIRSRQWQEEGPAQFERVYATPFSVCSDNTG